MCETNGICVYLPDGTTEWSEDDLDNLKEIARKWNKSHKKKINPCVFLGMDMIWMSYEDYQNKYDEAAPDNR